MCGISGYISKNNFDKTKILNSQKHRGPDFTDEFNTNIAGYNIFLGHNRLSIVDLSEHGKQPMKTDDNQYVIVYNGEIYNFETLRDKYLNNVKLHSKTDTEVVLNLYKVLGIDFIKELNGDFAIALLDKKEAKFYLIRDRVGVKPLYYSLSDNQLIFGSEIKAIKETGIELSLDHESVQNYFVFKYVPQQNTLFNEIKRIKPGTYLQFDLKSSKALSFTYWELNKQTKYEKINYDDAKQTLYKLLANSVHIRLMSDVPIGTFFSGGIDSSIIAYFLQDIKKITHYSARKTKLDLRNEGTTSDYYYSDRLARNWDLNIVPVDISSSEANTDLIKKTIYYSDDLIADGSHIPSYLITEHASKKSKVMLSGMGADEIFYGYPAHQISLIAMYFDKFPHFFSYGLSKKFSSLNCGKGMFKAYKRHLNKFGKYFLAGNNRYGFYNIVGDYENSLSVFNFDNNDSSAKIFSSYFDNNDNVFDAITKFQVDNFLVKNLHYVDRMCMANSIEGRVPYLDHRIIEFAYSIPDSFKISKTGNTKKILKDAFKDILPDYVINRRKAGFGMPLRSIFSDEKKINELIEYDFFGNFNNFSVDKIKLFVNNHLSGKEDNSALIYALISYKEWYKLNLNK